VYVQYGYVCVIAEIFILLKDIFFDVVPPKAVDAYAGSRAKRMVKRKFATVMLLERQRENIEHGKE